MKYEKMRTYISTHATLAAEQWFKDQCRNLYARFYLYYRPSDGVEPGALLVSEDPPNDLFIKASDTRLSPGWSTEQVRKFIYETAQTLPILPTTEETS